MKNKLSAYMNGLATISLLLLTLWFSGCLQDDHMEPDQTIIENVKMAAGDPVGLSNPGFESSWSGWNDTDPSAISSDANSGSKSAKITGSSGKFEQTVSVAANTNYTLSAFILEKGTIGAEVGSSDFNDGGDYSDWTSVSVPFNSGSQTSITIYGKYNGGTGRFDDFTLIEGSGGSGGSNGKLNISSVSASANDGNVPANTLDENLGTRWSANGSGEYITYDLGSSKTIESMKIAWYKGNERNSYFKIRAGASMASLSTVYDAETTGSSGNTLALETYSFNAVSARYIRITGFGNSSNTWNSVTEVEIWGSSSGGDTTPPGSVSNLSGSGGNGQVSLSWTNPSDSDFDHVTINYNGGSTTTSSNSKTVTGLSNGSSYTFTVVAYDTSGNASSGQSVNATPQGSGGGTYPTDIIPSLVDWKLTLPVDSNGDDSSNETDVDDRNTNPWEIKDNNLIDFEYPPYFEVKNGEVIFRAHCAGATTSGSKYPRSELRQRVGGGDNYWSVQDYQYLKTSFKVTHIPVEKPEISMVQIHGPSDEPLRVQYHEDIGVYIIWNESNKDTANALDYSLGEQLEVTVTVDNGDITCKIENLNRDEEYTKTWTSNDNTGYFKLGCYTQSSIFLSQFKSGYNDEPLNAYGEMSVSSIDLTETY